MRGVKPEVFLISNYNNQFVKRQIIQHTVTFLFYSQIYLCACADSLFYMIINNGGADGQ